MQIVPKAPLFPMQASEKGASGSQISPGGKRSQVYLSKISMYNGIWGFIPWHICIFLVHPLHSGSKFYFSVLGIFYIGLFLTSFFVPLMVNRYCFVEKLSFSALLYHILFKVWAPRRFYYWNLSGNLVGRALWHNHLCLPADPIPGLRLPRTLLLFDPLLSHCQRE